MSNYNNNIVFGGASLEITTLSDTREQKTIKQRIGNRLSQISIVGTTSYQWVIDITGVITADTLANLGVKRAALKLLDDAHGHTLIDGIHDGTYYIEPGSLSFTDVGGENINILQYSMRLIEV